MIYSGEELRELIFPIGGIGSGSIGLTGNGRLVDFEIYNRPDKGTHPGFSHFAVKVTGKNRSIAKVLNSDLMGEYMGRYGQPIWTHNYGFGPQNSTMAGFPHFKNCTFKGEFPIAELTFSDGDFPGKVTLRAFNPFIPLDSKNSSIPAAFFEIEYKNETDEPLYFDCALSLKYPKFNVDYTNKTVKRGKFMALNINADRPRDELDYCDMSIGCEDSDIIQQYWYRGEWNDNISTFWHEFSTTDTLIDRRYENGNRDDYCSVMKKKELSPGERATFRYVISWNVPNNYNYWARVMNDDMKNVDIYANKQSSWKNYYSTVFDSSVESGLYSLEKWDELYSKTKRFKDELFSSSLDDAIKDAISSTISVLKSPTMSRLEDGSLYGFEGVHEKEGSCEGLCQHVYNYAYATCFLFPNLEHSIRELELKYSLKENGAMNFRLGLPLGTEPTQGGHFPCLDGQMGTVIKIYRDWKLSGDDEWLRQKFDAVCSMVEFAYSKNNPYRWDVDRDGVLEGMQHHTLDMELVGPSSWLQGFYLAALKAAAEMASHLGYHDKSREYTEIYLNGREWTRQNLFNGEYFIQKVDLGNKELLAPFDEKLNLTSRYWNDETKQIKYQIGEGSSIDQLTGQWHADICGLGNIFDEDQIKKALDAMYRYNFKPSMRDVSNVWRVFALGDEAGTIMCDYPPHIKKPVIPITYCEECMTGFEYTFAALLAKHGYYDRAIEVVKAIRERYDGKKRNPYNEMECGSHYVRAMASFSLLPILSGFEFDTVNGSLGFNPVVKREESKFAFFSGTAWGSVTITHKKTSVCIIEGQLYLSTLSLPYIEIPKSVFIDGNNIDFDIKDKNICFDKICVLKSIEVFT